MSQVGGALEHDWYPEPLPGNVVIGDRSGLYSSFAFLHYRSERPVGVRIGDDTGVYYTTFFELGPEGEVDIGDFCAIVGAIINTNERVEIHDFAFVAHEVLLCDVPVAVPPTGSVDRGARRRSGIVIGENAWIGAKAVLLSGAHIGEGSIVGAGAVVDFEVPPYTTVAGNPARVISDRLGPAPG
jgi:acetyltransferase-like isoleucine patch superfamily enzyme